MNVAGKKATGYCRRRPRERLEWIGRSRYRDIGSGFAKRFCGHRNIRPSRLAAAFVALHARVATRTCHLLAAIALGRRGGFCWKEARELRQDRPPQREARTQCS